MIRQLVIPILFVLTITACGTIEEATPAPELEEIVLPTVIDTQPDVPIQESTRQQLGNGRGGYFLLQFHTPLNQDTQARLEAANVVLHDYVPDYAYYAYLPAESLAIIDQLVEAGILRHVGPIPTKAKLEAGLGEKIQADASQQFDVIVQFFEEPSTAAKEELEALMEVRDYSFGPVNLAEGTVAAVDVETVLSLPFVKWMEEQVLMDW
jgi:hypothetical protein